MNANEYLTQFFRELGRLVDGRGTRHTIAMTAAEELEVRLGGGDWYWAVRVALDNDPIKAALLVVRAERYFPTQI